MFHSINDCENSPLPVGGFLNRECSTPFLMLALPLHIRNKNRMRYGGPVGVRCGGITSSIPTAIAS